MPLAKDVLKTKFIGVFTDVQNRVIQVPNPPPIPVPLIPLPVASALANAYHEWAVGATAGGMIRPGGNPTLISGPLSSMPLMAGWGPGLATYWLAGPWTSVPPGTQTGISIPVTMAKVPVDIVTRLLTPPFPSRSSPQSKEEFADILATILHSNTTLMTVTQTIIQTGITVVVPVS